MNNIKPLPYSLECEQSLLGVLLTNNARISDVEDIILANYFYLQEHQIIFKSIISMFREKKTIDTITLIEFLAKQQKIVYVGGVDYVNQLAISVIPTADAVEYAKIIKENWELRQLINISQDLSANAYSGKDISVILEDIEKKIYSIRSSNAVEKLNTFEEILLDMVNDMQRKANGELSTTTPTGFINLDDMINGGFEEGELIIIAGRPGMGKTSLITNMIINMVVKKYAVIMLSIEMTPMQITQRITANLSQVSSKAIKTADLTTNDYEKIFEFLGDHKNDPIHFVPPHNPTITSIKSYCRKIASNIIKNNLDKLSCIVIDHLGLIQTRNPDENLSKSLAEITRELKVLAQELKVPVVLLCQLNRNVESRAIKRPMLSDLRDSGAIEQDADKVLLLYREDYYQSDQDKHNGNTTIIVAKNRDGELGEVNLSFEGKFNRLTESNYTDYKYNQAGDK